MKSIRVVFLDAAKILKCNNAIEALMIASESQDTGCVEDVFDECLRLIGDKPVSWSNRVSIEEAVKKLERLAVENA